MSDQINPNELQELVRHEGRFLITLTNRIQFRSITLRRLPGNVLAFYVAEGPVTQHGEARFEFDRIAKVEVL